MFVNYTDIMQRDVFDKGSCFIGRPYDFLVKLDSAYPPLIALVLSRSVFARKFAVIPWGDIKKVEDRIYLKVSGDTLKFTPDYKSEEWTSIRNAILDQQVVDTFNRKVVRVNDIHLLRVDRDIRIAHVDVSFRALIRRLGWEKVINTLVKLISPRSRYITREQLISWKYVQPLEVVSRKGTLHLNVSNEDLAAIPPADFGEIIGDLDSPERAALFRSLDFETQVDVLNELDVKMQKDLIGELNIQTAIQLLEKMEPDEVADLLGILSKVEASRILSLMSPAQAKKLHSLLKYESDSAGGLMTTDYVSLLPTMTAAEALEKIKKTELDVEMAYYAYILDDNYSLAGVVTVKKLLVSQPEEKISEIMTERPVSVHVDSSAKEAAFQMNKYDLLAMPVVDDEGVVKGIITIDDILAIAIDEAWGEKPGLL